ncbi:protein kinase [Bacteriovoracaceae bacterium]|nr:protein kinase [Bacteriovoracaceae bacterium]
MKKITLLRLVILFHVATLCLTKLVFASNSSDYLSEISSICGQLEPGPEPDTNTNVQQKIPREEQIHNLYESLVHESVISEHEDKIFDFVFNIGNTLQGEHSDACGEGHNKYTIDKLTFEYEIAEDGGIYLLLDPLTKPIGEGSSKQVYKAIFIPKDENKPPHAVAHLLDKNREHAMKQRGENKVIHEILKFQKLQKKRVPKRRISGIPKILHQSDFNGATFAPLYDFDGSNLPQPLSQLGDQDTRKVIEDLLLALNAIHDSGYAHRDIKPENILLKKDPRTGLFDDAVLADFGLAVSSDTAWDKICYGGTALFNSPEIFIDSLNRRKSIYGNGANALEAAKKHDVFALGLSLFQMYSGTSHPFFRQNHSSYQTHHLFTERYKEISLSNDVDRDNQIQLLREQYRLLVGNAYKNQIQAIQQILGKCRDNPIDIFDVICHMLEIDPVKRISAATALGHFENL